MKVVSVVIFQLQLILAVEKNVLHLRLHFKGIQCVLSIFMVCQSSHVPHHDS